MANQIFGQSTIDDHNYLKVNSDGSIDTNSLTTLVPVAHDQIDLTYVASGDGAGEIETVTYKLDAITVATLTLSYNGSNKLTSVVRS